MIPIEEWVHRLLETPGLQGMGHHQRPKNNDMGLGWLYYALARIIRPQIVVCIGSYRGFTPLVFGRALADNRNFSRVIFIDPSFVDDFWTASQSVATYFAAFGLTNIDHYCLTTSDFLQTETYKALTNIDLVFIDGYHSYDQVKADFNAFWGRLKSDGIILFHDSALHNIGTIYGPGKLYTKEVPIFIEELRQRNDLQIFDLHLGSGVALVSRRPLVKSNLDSNDNI